MSIAHVTANFLWSEFHCHDGEEVPLELQPNVRRLCTNVLEPLRARFGGPLVVISGYRSFHYNEALRRAGGGAAEKSRHMTGEAADIRPAEIEALPRLRALVETMITQGELPALGGFGIYPAWVHLDVRERVPAGHLARWFGRGVGSEL